LLTTSSTLPGRQRCTCDEQSNCWTVEHNVQWWGGYFLKGNNACGITVRDFYTTKDSHWLSPASARITITGTVATQDAANPVVTAVREAAGLSDAYVDIAY
jgi:hypothetical protein